MSSKLNIFKKKKSSLGRRHTVSGEQNETIDKAKNELESDQINNNIITQSITSHKYATDSLVGNNNSHTANSAEANGTNTVKPDIHLRYVEVIIILPDKHKQTS